MVAVVRLDRGESLRHRDLGHVVEGAEMQNSTLKSNARRGVAVVVTAVTLTLLIGFAALAIDVGYMYSVQA